MLSLMSHPAILCQKAARSPVLFRRRTNIVFDRPICNLLMHTLTCQTCLLGSGLPAKAPSSTLPAPLAFGSSHNVTRLDTHPRVVTEAKLHQPIDTKCHPFSNSQAELGKILKRRQSRYGKDRCAQPKKLQTVVKRTKSLTVPAMLRLPPRLLAPLLKPRRPLQLPIAPAALLCPQPLCSVHALYPAPSSFLLVVLPCLHVPSFKQECLPLLYLKYILCVLSFLQN